VKAYKTGNAQKYSCRTHPAELRSLQPTKGANQKGWTWLSIRRYPFGRTCCSERENDRPESAINAARTLENLTFLYNTVTSSYQ
jgi:hypothetical protein